ncbi:S8/S53 family peptidase [Microscilla marina]|nr:S8/S53 family peptidase [Microscilla marina]
MKKYMLIAVTAFLMGSCSTRTEDNVTPDPQQSVELVNKATRDKIIADNLKTKGEFEWAWVDNATLFSAITDGNDGSMTVGYMPEGFKNINTRMHEIDVKSSEWVKAKEQLISDIQAVYKKYGINKTRKELVLREHDVLPFFKVSVSIVQVVDLVRNSPKVRYAEPSTYNFTMPGQNNHRITGSPGCGSETSGTIPSADYFRASDNALVSWHLEKNRVTQAWGISGKGRNINLGVIDTGTSPAQPKLGSSFNGGYSNVGRRIQRYGTFAPSVWFWQKRKIDGPNDDCGHGTSMSGVMAAPRTTDGTPTGVAYESNLYAVRGTDDVMLNSGDEQDGVSDALVLLANKNTHIISMSLGNLWSVGQIADAVRYAYGKGKMIFSAAGTSFSWANNIVGVIFPATMSEILAVTGVTDRNGYKECHNCHYGRKVDFVLVMQRDGSSSRTALTLPMSGNSPDQVGGSSVATATMAGIAALVWSTNPSQSRATVLQRLKSSAEFYPNRNSSFGWGKVDAYKAVASVQ